MTRKHRPPKTEIAARLLQARKDAGYRSGRAFAQACGFNVTTVAHHENGHRTFDADTASEYARCLGVTPGWLMFGEEPAIKRIKLGRVIMIDGFEPDDHMDQVLAKLRTPLALAHLFGRCHLRYLLDR